MKRLFKSRKALSPVVAAIILIAVTVAVSIAVAAWMGALTFTFMQTEELKVLSHTWNGTTYIDLSVKNTGTGALTISEVRVNDAIANVTYTSGSATLDPTSSPTATLRITQSFTSGVKYEFAILTANGNKYAYIATAP